jgi:DNA mismatch repair protein MutS2
MVIATTHYDSLKTYASTTQGVVAAGFGFDPGTFAPTYRLAYGSPGSSLAFEIATRLGLPVSIIERARAHRSERESQLAEHLAKVQRDMQTLDHERRLVARERETLADGTSRLHVKEQELREREDAFRKRLDARVEERLREARKEIDAVMNSLKARTGALAADADRRAARLVPTGASGALRAEARAAIDAIGDRLKAGGTAAEPAAVRAAPAVSRPAAVGDRVIVGALGLEGTVKSIHDRDAEVDVRGKRLRARVDELQVIGGPPAQPAKVRVNVELQPREGLLTELNVVGCSVDEALARTEKFLDDSLMSELRSVRLIHGYGTGQLRRAIAGYLQSLPYVTSFAAAPPEQGGGGVTVVELKE